MRDFVFKVKLVAVVHVRAADESAARKVVPTVLGAPAPLRSHWPIRTMLQWATTQRSPMSIFPLGRLRGRGRGSWRKSSTILPISP